MTVTKLLGLRHFHLYYINGLKTTRILHNKRLSVWFFNPCGICLRCQLISVEVTLLQRVLQFLFGAIVLASNPLAFGQGWPQWRGPNRDGCSRRFLFLASWPESLKLKWRNPEIFMYMNSPVLSGDLLFGFSHQRRGQFFCIDARTGATLWKSEGGREITPQSSFLIPR